jgi:hypothetical protein
MVSQKLPNLVRYHLVSRRHMLTWFEVEWHEEVRTAIPLMIAAVQDSDVALEASHSLLRLAKLGNYYILSSQLADHNSKRNSVRTAGPLFWQ